MSNSGMYGGGIVLNYTGAIVKNNVIAQNTVYQAVSGAATFGGGGIWAFSNFGSAPKIIENNTIVGNSSAGSGSSFAGRGGGILVASTSVIARNNIIWDNTQTTSSQIGAITGGTANVTFSDVQGGWTGAGNIDQEPAFGDTSYYLSGGSPCVDAGDSSSVYNDPEDPGNPGFARWPSRGGLRNDMGAYGGPGSSVLGVIVTSVREIRGSGVPEEYFLVQNYPNPFNPSTTIEFALPRSGFTTLKVYDILVRHVATLVQEELPAGRFSVEWNARGYASGVYYYKLQAGTFSQIRKIVLLK